MGPGWERRDRGGKKKPYTNKTQKYKNALLGGDVGGVKLRERKGLKVLYSTL
jgi:hypothetical protein